MTEAIAQKYARLAEIRATGHYMVIVARFNGDRIVFSRPGMTICGPGPLPIGQELAELQFNSGMRAVDHYVSEHPGEGETLDQFYRRFKMSDETTKTTETTTTEETKSQPEGGAPQQEETNATDTATAEVKRAPVTPDKTADVQPDR